MRMTTNQTTRTRTYVCVGICVYVHMYVCYLLSRRFALT